MQKKIKRKTEKTNSQKSDTRLDLDCLFPGNGARKRGLVDGVYSYQTSYGFVSGQIPRRSQGTLLPSSGEPKVSNPWNNVQRKDSI
jgi:hypothetical protein